MSGSGQPADVVDHRRSRHDGGLCDRDAPGVHRDRDPELAEAFDHREHAPGLLLRRYGGTVGPARLSPDVDQVCAGAHHLRSVTELLLDRRQMVKVRHAVWSCV
jgi:hypothetical protein